MPEDDPSELEFQHVIEGVETLHACAVEHEAKQSGPEKEPCIENRAWIVAMTMHRLGLSVIDIGQVAESLFEIECDHAHAEADNETPVDILDAQEVE